jgi:arginine N-succinyltransferase
LTRPALAMLESEGFRYEGHVDIFDAGPAVECDIDDIGAVAASRIYQVAVEREPTGRAVDAPAVHYLLSNIRLGGFRAMVVRGTPAGNTFRLTAAEAAALGVDDGDSVRAVPLSPRDRIDHRPH